MLAAAHPDPFTCFTSCMRSGDWRAGLSFGQTSWTKVVACCLGRGTFAGPILCLYIGIQQPSTAGLHCHRMPGYKLRIHPFPLQIVPWPRDSASCRMWFWGLVRWVLIVQQVDRAVSQMMRELNILNHRTFHQSVVVSAENPSTWVPWSRRFGRDLIWLSSSLPAGRCAWQNWCRHVSPDSGREMSSPAASGAFKFEAAVKKLTCTGYFWPYFSTVKTVCLFPN